MFFGLTNSLVMFQMIMNKILQGLINTREVRSKLAENDLYIKPEKCKQKVRKIGFLEVIIGLKGIKIKEEKIKRVLNQLTSKEVKNVQKFLRLANYY